MKNAVRAPRGLHNHRFSDPVRSRIPVLILRGLPTLLFNLRFGPREIPHYVLMTIELGGFLGIAAVEHGQAEIRQRLARLEGLLLEGLREAVTGRPVSQ